MLQLIRYKWVLLALLVDCAIALWNPSLGSKVAVHTSYGIVEMFSFLPPVFIILGLLDTWVPRETVVANLGKESGIKGLVLSIILGSAAAGPLYGAFPVAAVMIKKGASYFNVMVFLQAWATLKIPMVIFETQYLGGLFAATRWICSLTGIILIAYLINHFLTDSEKHQIYTKHS